MVQYNSVDVEAASSKSQIQLISSPINTIVSWGTKLNPFILILVPPASLPDGFSILVITVLYWNLLISPAAVASPTFALLTINLYSPGKPPLK